MLTTCQRGGSVQHMTSTTSFQDAKDHNLDGYSNVAMILKDMRRPGWEFLISRVGFPQLQLSSSMSRSLTPRFVHPLTHVVCTVAQHLNFHFKLRPPPFSESHQVSIVCSWVHRTVCLANPATKASLHQTSAWDSCVGLFTDNGMSNGTTWRRTAL